MLTHIALLKFRKGIFNQDKQLVVDKIINLKKKIPEILKATGGADCVKLEATVDHTKGYSHAIHMEFADDKAFLTYLQHPAQHELDEMLKKSLEDVVLVTYKS